jgi:catechol 2,3-dioxygenase-like lactoylglutathione lyase family enzyme
VLGGKEVMATVAVSDLDAARRFYGDTLGFRLTNQESDALTYQAGGSKLLVYQSQFAGSNQATAATWVIGNDMEKVVQWLRTRGVAFEHYALPGMTLKGDIHVANGFKAAWFKDPDGNIHALVSS